ncbi:MAG: phosphoglucosamine mutase [Lachnospiraceae bacterium]|nr:phosphoglucosamine mutase [Lachnospiraceae bacterium]
MKYFGTDGFRGEANVTLNATHAYKIGRYLGSCFGGGKERRTKIVIGKDTRCSGDMFEHALAAGLASSGADAYLLDVVPTPCVSYIVRNGGFDCGIMISASHNPYTDNGIKIIDCNGHKISAEVEAEIEKYIDGEEDAIPLAIGDGIGKIKDYAEGKSGYVQYLTSLAKSRFSNYKVALDCSNGSASAVAKGVFETLGAVTSVIHAEPNGVNINNNCGSTHIEVLQRHVKSCGADVGFAFDGDADRCIAVDNNGNVVDGDSILYLCGCQMDSCGELDRSTVVTTVMSNIGLYKAFDAKGIKYEKTDVGDKYVYENMIDNGYSLGGEQSGHIIFGRHATTGDGILTAIKVMEVIVGQKTELSKLLEDLKIYPQKLVNVRVKDKQAALDDKDVISVSRQIEEELGGDGRLLLRKSGTEPLIRVMAEAETIEQCEKYTDMVVGILKKKGHAL